MGFITIALDGYIRRNGASAANESWRWDEIEDELCIYLRTTSFSIIIMSAELGPLLFPMIANRPGNSYCVITRSPLYFA